MVRATIIVSALVAFVASASAVPASLVDVRTSKHIGTGNINAQRAGSRVVNANNLEVKDAAQNVDVLDGNHGHGGVLGNLLKREEAAAAPVRIAKKAGMKGRKMNAKRMGAKKAAQKI